MILQKVTFQKSQKLLAENLHERPPRFRPPCPGGEQFLVMLKSDLFRFHLILFFIDSSKRNFV